MGCPTHRKASRSFFRATGPFDAIRAPLKAQSASLLAGGGSLETRRRSSSSGEGRLLGVLGGPLTHERRASSGREARLRTSRDGPLRHEGRASWPRGNRLSGRRGAPLGSKRRASSGSEAHLLRVGGAPPDPKGRASPPQEVRLFGSRDGPLHAKRGLASTQGGSPRLHAVSGTLRRPRPTGRDDDERVVRLARHGSRHPGVFRAQKERPPRRQAPPRPRRRPTSRARTVSWTVRGHRPSGNDQESQLGPADPVRLEEHPRRTRLPGKVIEGHSVGRHPV